MNSHKGFTLIELMIVVAIIAILAAIAMSQYQDYVIRAQLSEGMSLADAVKTTIGDFYQNRGRFPISNPSAGLADPTEIVGNYVTQVSTTNGVITSTFGNKVNAAVVGATLEFSPITHAGSIEWRCKKGGSTPPLEDRWLPTNCRN
jgi:type IV pilus assembly protein PilA